MNCDLYPCQLDAIKKYCNEILSNAWNESHGDQVWCAGFRTACEKIIDIANQNLSLSRWGTEIKAIDPLNPERGIANYIGPSIQALTKQSAIDFCQENALGYLKVTDQIVMEIPCKSNSYEADFDKKIDYENNN